ncbi:ATP-binding protein [uncultured Methanobrevibacter sp.]|uniref:ATP-binding protein n=1 Tax=uncultured Methanobrevibacter sp. TaxID=253161 RepID=UPI002617F68A|nr:DUF4143 domain-containing protein [uncultured Methanobrevibacter sp.]
MPEIYYERILDETIEKRLKMIGAIVIEGPKWCGKTTTAKQHAKSVLELQDPDNRQNYLELADIMPSKLLEGETPRLIDEWQMAPLLWDAVRTKVDKTPGYGHFILTGSTSIDFDKTMHTGTGRVNRMTMLPMSLYESKESNGKLPILDLFENPNMDINGIESDLTMEELAFATCRGGWPESVIHEDKEAQLFVVENYVDNICKTDISTVDGVKRDRKRAEKILKSYARNNSTEATKQTILKDVRGNFPDMAYTTLDDYLKALSKLFVTVDIPAWNPNIRSKTAVKSSDKREFIDPSIATTLLNLDPEGLLFDLDTFGHIFENLCYRDLMAYTSSKGGQVSYYRDRYGLECDCVLSLKNEDYALIEFKLGSKKIEKGAKNLLKLDKIIKEKNTETDLYIKEPKFLAVITGGKFAHTREDGVKILPIGCLR